MPVSAQDVDTADSGRVAYPATFFQPYNPLTARDMVVQVPGFSLDESGDARGFGGTAGNVLIGGTRPSTKNDDAGAILGRIPASQVLRIDLIRGDTGGLNLRGQTVVVDVILRADALPATRWESRLRTTGSMCERAGRILPCVIPSRDARASCRTRQGMSCAWISGRT